MKRVVIQPDLTVSLGLDMVPGPVFSDACHHGEDCYVCTFAIADLGHMRGRDERVTVGKRRFDLYLFDEKHYGNEVCLRYGNEPEQYISPGGLGNFMQHAHSPWHVNKREYYAEQFLLAFGKFKWELRSGC